MHYNARDWMPFGAGMDFTSLVATTSSIDHSLLQRLFRGELLAVRVPGFCTERRCQILAERLYERLSTQRAQGGGIYDSDIDSFWSAYGDETRRNRYFDSALPLQRRLRDLSSPYSSPIDVLRLALDEAWPAGACLLSMSGRKLPFGITRLWETGSTALPHQDVLWREIGRDGEAASQVGQLGVNVYLETSGSGGELELWNFKVSDIEYERSSNDYRGSYGYPRSMLPEESVVVTPEVGDLILLDTTRVHAVRGVTEGRRITLSGFIGSWGEEQPLRCWS